MNTVIKTSKKYKSRIAVSEIIQFRPRSTAPTFLKKKISTKNFDCPVSLFVLSLNVCSLSDSTQQVRDLVEQLSSGGKSAHELEKALRRAALEREELARALEEAERALEQGEARAALAQLELANARADAERRVREIGEEVEGGRRLQARALESMQASLDGEVRSKAECVRQKRKLEGDVSELEVALDQANR